MNGTADNKKIDDDVKQLKNHSLLSNFEVKLERLNIAAAGPSGWVVVSPKGIEKGALDCNSSQDMFLRKSRRSQRLGSSNLPNFRALSLHGREATDSDTTQAVRDSTPAGSKPSEFFKRQSFTTYDDLMRFTKKYENQKSVRLNASVITPDERQPSMSDSEFYRYVTLWCNFDAKNMKALSAYTPLDRRYCPFYVRVAGHEKENRLVVEEISGKHVHSPTANVLGPPRLPAAVSSAETTPSFFPTRSRVTDGSQKTSRVDRRKMGRITKPNVIRKRNRVRSRLSDHNRRRRRDKERRAVDGIAHKRVTEVTFQGVNNALNMPTSSVATQPNKSENDKAENCGLCGRLCKSTDELVGHVWLVHQILSQRLVF